MNPSPDLSLRRLNANLSFTASFPHRHEYDFGHVQTAPFGQLCDLLAAAVPVSHKQRTGRGGSYRGQ
ncbi:MAG: hypothetical protein ACXWTN_03670 [Methylosarcina sp.]